MEDSGPLERCSVLRLTGGAVAQFRVQRLLPAQLIFDAATVAVGLVLDWKLVFLLVDAIGGAFLPCVGAFSGVFAGGLLVLLAPLLLLL